MKLSIIYLRIFVLENESIVKSPELFYYLKLIHKVGFLLADKNEIRAQNKLLKSALAAKRSCAYNAPSVPVLWPALLSLLFLPSQADFACDVI